MSRPSVFIISVIFAAVGCAAPMTAHPIEPGEAGAVGQSAGTGRDEPAAARAARPGMDAAPSDEFGNVTEEEAAEEQVEAGRIADPLEPANRFFFKVNDKLYFWVLKPAAKGYRKVVPEDFRVLFANFYNNITAPIRIVNKLLQLKLKDAGTEFARLAINSTVGAGGLRDCAGECFGVRARDADFGQTLGYYGVGQGLYLMWPFLGPSTARETAGYGFDWFLYPSTWFAPFLVSAGARAHERVNSLSFHIGDYEALKKAAVDPYVAVRNAYVQNRAAFVGQARKGEKAQDTKNTEKERAEVNGNRP